MTAPRIEIAARYPGNRTFRQVLEEIRDVYDARSELFTGGDDCAANLADRARLALDAARPEVEASPIDIMDEILRPVLGSMLATSMAMTLFLALRRAGHLTASSDMEKPRHDP